MVCIRDGKGVTLVSPCGSRRGHPIAMPPPRVRAVDESFASIRGWCQLSHASRAARAEARRAVAAARAATLTTVNAPGFTDGAPAWATGKSQLNTAPSLSGAVAPRKPKQCSKTQLLGSSAKEARVRPVNGSPEQPDLATGHCRAEVRRCHSSRRGFLQALWLQAVTARQLSPTRLQQHGA